MIAQSGAYGGGIMKAKVFVALLSACALLPTASSATSYTYNAASGDIIPGFSFTTSLSGAALDNLALTDITGTVSPFNLSPTLPPSDNLGFPLGPGSGPSGGLSVLIATNAFGLITSWNISEFFFASYPAVAGENPTDFFCNYTGSTASGGSSLKLTLDNDAGLCPVTTSSLAGTFSGDSGEAAATPLPAALPLFATGLGALGLFGWRRKRKQAA
jgi:hypothetical protein